MEQEEKELVLHDLCARLPYKVIVDYSHNAFDVHNGEYIKHGSKCILNCHLLNVFISPRQNEKGEYIKPYLRPLSSMTEEEWRECVNLGIGDEFEDSYGEHRHLLPSHRLYDWLNAHHFDYRGLIEKGLAISTNEFNPYKD